MESQGSFISQKTKEKTRRKAAWERLGLVLPTLKMEEE